MTLDLNSIQDGVIIVFTCSPDSEFAQKQLSLINAQKNYYESNNATVLFISEEEAEGFVTDTERQLINKAERLQGKANIGENLIIFTKKDDEIKFCEVKEDPENDLNWAENITEFVKNFNDPNPGEKGMYKWGQLVQETGEYLCVDCGYIEELEEGKIFPICVVCLSGEVDGPSGPAEEYWERV